MRDNLLTEISRINEIMGVQILSEAVPTRFIFGALKGDVPQVLKQSIETLLKRDVRTLLNKGITSLDNQTLRTFITGSDSRLISGIERNLGRSLDAAEVNQVKIAAIKDLRKVHAEEAAKLAQKSAKQTTKKTAEKAGTETGQQAAQGININIVNKNSNKIKGEMGSLKGKGSKTKTKPTQSGGQKKLTAPEPTPQEATKIASEVESKSGKELMEEITEAGVKRDWKYWAKRAAIAGISAYVLWWMFFSDDDTEVPEDIPVVPPPMDDDNGGGGGGSSTSSYRDCEEEELQTYGCNSSLIKKVQECLGVVVDGKWGPKTNTALTANAAKFTAGFTEEDIDEICESVTSNNSNNNNKPIEYDEIEFRSLEPMDMGSGNSSSNATNFGTLNMD